MVSELSPSCSFSVATCETRDTPPPKKKKNKKKKQGRSCSRKWKEVSARTRSHNERTHPKTQHNTTQHNVQHRVYLELKLPASGGCFRGGFLEHPEAGAEAVNLKCSLRFDVRQALEILLAHAAQVVAKRRVRLGLVATAATGDARDMCVCVCLCLCLCL